MKPPGSSINRRTANTCRASLFFCLTLLMSTACGQTYDGAELYAANCSNCHGIYGEGDGAVTPELSVVLQDLRYLSQRNDGEFPEDFVFKVVDGRELRVAHGPAGMPVWGVEFSRSEGYSEDAQERVAAKISALTAFLKQIQITE